MSASTPSTKAVILVIDDEPAVLAEVMETLTQTGYTCHGCTSVETALATATRVRPDLIVSDINLGEESGLDLCRDIKSQAELADVPLIFLSGAAIPNIVRRAHAAGGTYYLRKPFDPEVLIELTEKALWLPHLVKDQVALS